MNRSWMLLGAILLVANVSAGMTVWAEEAKTGQRYELAELMERAKVSLAQGLTASHTEGTPISGKFEVGDGKLQLSIYTMKGSRFSEVVIDHQSGTVAKVELITEGDDLTAAKTQSAAMASAKDSLEMAVNQAVKGNPGFAAVSVTPSVKDGRPVAEVTLTNGEGEELKKVSEPLS